MECSFIPADILLPAPGVDPGRWAVVACDQYTSQPHYWKQAEELTKGVPSALNIVYPEVYLSEGEKRIAGIRSAMDRYLEAGVLTEQIHQGFVLVARTVPSGIRLGLVGALDLEHYDFTPGTDAPVRATEGTIASRIPPRVRIRQGAPIESPHVMVLIDDPEKELIEALYESRHDLPVLYDTDLMLGGGHITGYGIAGETARSTAEHIAAMESRSGGFFLAVGDGNHSLATAKACWEQIKASLTEEEQKEHPARYALVELVNLHSPALIFEPIHRVLFGADVDDLKKAFLADLAGRGMEAVPGSDIVYVHGTSREGLALKGAGDRLPVDVLQSFLDRYLEAHPGVEIDYVHGEDAVRELAEKDGNLGILLGPIDKNGLFPAIAAGGVLPRKTFSMGEAYEKRYYMECRRIG